MESCGAGGAGLGIWLFGFSVGRHGGMFGGACL